MLSKVGSNSGKLLKKNNEDENKKDCIEKKLKAGDDGFRKALGKKKYKFAKNQVVQNMQYNSPLE